MEFLRTFVVVFFFSLTICTSNIIDIAFTVKNLSSNDRLKENFLTMITSLFEHTSMDNLRLHVIADPISQQFVDQTLQDLHYHSQIHRWNIEELSVQYEQLISPLIKQFSTSHTYYKDPLFFLSLFLHRIFPEEISRVIMLDIDLRFEEDVGELYQLFDRFNASQIIGIARENQPVYRHLLWTYRQENPQTEVGNPPPDGLTGFNSGVLLLHLTQIRQSITFNNYLDNPPLVERLLKKYHFTHPHLGDQDFYSLLSFEHRELFYFLPCYWNRQLCTWWKGKGYDDVWEKYFNCNNDQHIRLYHGNCHTTIPKKINQSKVEL